VTDLDLEKRIGQGADATVMDTMGTCTGSLDGKTGDVLSTALAECEEITKDAFIKSKMYTDVDGLSGEAKSKQERSIEVEYQVSKKKAAGQKAIIEAKAETEKLNAIADKTSTEYKTKYTAAKEKVKKSYGSSIGWWRH
jgi:hypothetical protein